MGTSTPLPENIAYCGQHGPSCLTKWNRLPLFVVIAVIIHLFSQKWNLELFWEVQKALSKRSSSIRNEIYSILVPMLEQIWKTNWNLIKKWKAWLFISSWVWKCLSSKGSSYHKYALQLPVHERAGESKSFFQACPLQTRPIYWAASVSWQRTFCFSRICNIASKQAVNWEVIPIGCENIEIGRRYQNRALSSSSTLLCSVRIKIMRRSDTRAKALPWTVDTNPKDFHWKGKVCK